MMVPGALVPVRVKNICNCRATNNSIRHKTTFVSRHTSSEYIHLYIQHLVVKPRYIYKTFYTCIWFFQAKQPIIYRVSCPLHFLLKVISELKHDTFLTVDLVNLNICKTATHAESNTRSTYVYHATRCRVALWCQCLPGFVLIVVLTSGTAASRPWIVNEACHINMTQIPDKRHLTCDPVGMRIFLVRKTDGRITV